MRWREKRTAEAGFDWGNLNFNYSDIFFVLAAFIAYNLSNKLFRENKSNGTVEYIFIREIRL